MTHSSPQRPIVRRSVNNGRLSYYFKSADSDFWNDHWRSHLASVNSDWAEEGKLGHFEEAFTRYLPKQGRILEAGCGLGQFVRALRVRGFDCEGIEWSEETVDAVKRLHPELPIRSGDAINLDVPDGYYEGYVSLGVVEHRQAGPEPFLQEAYRVLGTKGVLLLSVPCFNSLRKLKAHLGAYQDSEDGTPFYQYAYTVVEMRSLLLQAGFVVIDTFAYDVIKGLGDELPFMRHVLKWKYLGWRLEGFLRTSALLRILAGHMILFVCQKLPSSR